MTGIYVEFEVDSGAEAVIAELSEADAGIIPVGIDPAQVARRAAVTFDEALGKMRIVAESALQNVQRLTRAPDEMSLDFGIKLTADVGAVLAKAGGEAHLNVSLTWRATSPPVESS